MIAQKVKYGNRRDDSIIVEENQTLIEISSQIETDKVEFKRFHNKIEFHARLLMYHDDPLARWVDYKQYISETSYNHAVKMLKENLRIVKLDLETAKEHPLYSTMAAIVESRIKFFKSDFTYHDCLHLSRMPETEFIWIVRDCGTWFLSQAASSEILDYCIAHNPDAVYYHCNGTVRKVTPREAGNILHCL